MKWFALLAAAILLIAVGLFIWTVHDEQELDRVEVNRISRAIEREWPNALEGNLPESNLNYLFVEQSQTLHSYSAQQGYETGNFDSTFDDALIDVLVDGAVVGQIVIIGVDAQQLTAARTQMVAIVTVAFVLLALSCAFLALYLHKTILRPFRKLETFASRVAQGDLNFPLEMDKKNRFGAFSESFDLMREQLATARENERLANISKKELVASLSHDIKTPVTSIKVIAELHRAKHGTTSEMESIAGKADKIDLLISNMFTATLEELEQLKVSVGEVTSVELEDYIKASDYQKRVRNFSLPECVITADSLRLRQVIDNIIDNSYKYADTDIEVSGSFDKPFFVLTIRDFGQGVSPEEMLLLCEKYYRASNTESKSGAGLGLYLSHYFLEEMGGSLTIEDATPGLQITLRMKI